MSTAGFGALIFSLASFKASSLTDLLNLIPASVLTVPSLRTPNLSPNFSPFSVIIEFGSIPPLLAAISGLKYLSNQLSVTKFHPTGMFVLYLPTSFLSASLAKASSL